MNPFIPEEVYDVAVVFCGHDSPNTDPAALEAVIMPVMEALSWEYVKHPGDCWDDEAWEFIAYGERRLCWMPSCGFWWREMPGGLSEYGRCADAEMFARLIRNRF